MSEKEIRSLLGAIRADLDRAIRKALLPTALGASLALCAGCGHRESKSDTKTADASVDVQQSVDAPRRPEFRPIPPYMAPDAAPLHQHLNRQA